MRNVYLAEDGLYHFGIKGQRWGIRRFETESGHLTEAGKRRYGIGDARQALAKGAVRLARVKNRADAAADRVMGVADRYFKTDKNHGVRGLANRVIGASKKAAKVSKKKEPLVSEKNGKRELTERGKLAE